MCHLSSLQQLYSSNFQILYSCSAGPEYGTTEAAWKAVLVEADRRGALHNRVKEDLNTKVVADIKQWQKDSFHKVNYWTILVHMGCCVVSW